MIKLKESDKIEFWIVTGFLICAFLFSISELFHANPSASISSKVEINGVTQFNFSQVTSAFIPILFNYSIIYIIYLLLCFYVTPELEMKDKRASNKILFVFLLLLVCVFMDIILIYFSCLLALKILTILFMRNQKNNENALSVEAAFLISSWILLITAFSFLNTPHLLKVYLLFVLPSSILIYLYSVYNLIPLAKSKRWKFMHYFGNMIVISIISSLAILASLYLILPEHNFSFGSFDIPPGLFVPVTIKSLYMFGLNETVIGVAVGGNFFTQLLITLPVSWRIYKDRNNKKVEEIITLKTELGKSDANLNFLKSQINPHFLFNALNTLFGTALQENAERTGEGIQKLGDMMRFMLQENMEDKIALTRDIDYLKNYIVLQKLRTSTSDDIRIETQIDDQTQDLEIAPMLLIPFVENAFKHGISLKYPSHIKITLQISDKKLYFDVHNSIHLKVDNDPEKLQSGIGLQNVQQRLALQYANRHELIIRENAKEFFIHLTIELDKIS
ncbi:sensor histidine kinase [Pedobacter metabolipauper]|uniref:Histidine kinase n=1 Tax=Pedobacter metabolipauper TaxID=425513 RepID=A0A4R6SSQ0_9SPHI|nr:histidine kinase [Pedobacter metabolipauper]TDQ07621.1 histidine kinase [Pedobacter metabolipauper]